MVSALASMPSRKVPGSSPFMWIELMLTEKTGFIQLFSYEKDETEIVSLSRSDFLMAIVN